MTKQDVSEYLQVSVRTIERLIASGELTAHGIAGKTRIHPDDLAAYLKNTRRPMDPK